MQYQGTGPAHKERPEPSQQEMEAAILNLLMGEDSFTIWIRDEMAHEFPHARVAFCQGRSKSRPFSSVEK